MIKVKNLSCRYSAESNEVCIENLNLHVKKGEFVVLCGESGCGKTTVTRLLNGLIPYLYGEITEGQVYINGEDIKEVELSDLANVCGSVFQNPKSQFFNTDTTGELAFGCENLNYTKNQIQKRISKTVKRLSLEQLVNRDIFKLSGGEKQQIACGSIYATDPEIYILDEPSSNMDSKAIMRLQSILKTLKEQGKTIIISEHRLYFLMGLADRFLYFRSGKLIESYTAKQLRDFSLIELSQNGFRTTDLKQLKPSIFNIHNNSEKFQLKRVVCNRNGKQVLNIPDLKLPCKSVVAIIGENGAGKSTFAEVFTGILKSKGTIQLNDNILKAKARTEKSYVVMQDVNRQLFSNTVESEISLGAKKENLKKIDDLMNTMGILQYKKQHPAAISGGQKQRVAICAAIAAEKDIMIYDEPTSGLDFSSMKNLCNLIQSQREKHKITMIITHDLELILECCTHVLHLSNGEIKDFYNLDMMGFRKLSNFFIESREG